MSCLLSLTPCHVMLHVGNIGYHNFAPAAVVAAVISHTPALRQKGVLNVQYARIMAMQDVWPAPAAGSRPFLKWRQQRNKIGVKTRHIVASCKGVPLVLVLQRLLGVP